jgi:hypothetical protein
MLSIFARSFMEATRTGSREQTNQAARQRWLPEDHWWRQKSGTREKVSLDRTFGHR